MSEDYTSDIAEHYAAYRPPLHPLILEKCLGREERFQTGLDIGSGAGQSTLALTRYCRQITGVEPNPDMLAMAIPHPQVTYLPFDGKKLPFPDRSFDLITFAGSLFYGKSQELLDEVLRVSTDASAILVYDFEVLYDRLFSELKITPPVDDSPYDHATDFSGLENDGLEKLLATQEEISFDITPSNLAHLLLSYKYLQPVFAGKYGQNTLYDILAKDLENLSTDGIHHLPVRIYYTRYHYRRKMGE